MKKLTIEEVSQALIENCSMEMEWNRARYFLHITDNGEILSGQSGADESFSTYTDAPEVDYDWREEFETLDNDAFREVCEDLCKQANDYLEAWWDEV